MVGMVQTSLLNNLVDGARLTRMIDNEKRTTGEAFKVSELFGTLTGSIWSELGRNTDSFRRNLQRSYVDQMTRVLLNVRPSPAAPAYPEDARSLARYELTRLSTRIGAASSGNLDVETRAHLAESKARIDKALDVSITVAPR
jgi:hypothetical protein